MNWKTIFKSLKYRDMQKRLLALLGIIIIVRFLAHVPVPLADPTALKQIVENMLNSSNFGSVLNLLSGGALSSLSIILVGLSPFITVSIISQLLKKAIPRLEELDKDGESGRKKINQWTRVASVPIAIIQSIAFIFILRTSYGSGSDFDSTQWIVAVAAMTAGSVLMMWLGEILTEQGVGQGISILIFAGIISQFPTTLSTIIGSLFDITNGSLSVFGWFNIPVNPTVFWIVLGISVLAIAVLYILVKINEAQRIITVNYAKRVQGNSSYGGVKSILPIKMLAAGVVPVIFAAAFLSLFSLIGQVLKSTGNPAYAVFAENLIVWFQIPQPGTFTGGTITDFIYPAVYFLLIILFSYFYTGIVFNANQIAENLQQQGGFIDGVRPGEATETYLRRTVYRLVFFGSITLGLMAILPFGLEYLFAVLGITNAGSLALGGTSLLIVVSVGIESLRQINSRALMVTYDDYK